MAYAIGHISGCHLNRAVSLGLVIGKRFPISDLIPYWVAQVLGGIVGAGVLYIIASGKSGFSLSGGFACNGYADHSPGGYSLVACLVAEIVLTFFFLLVIHGGHRPPRPKGFPPYRYRSLPNAHPSDRHSRHQSLGKSRAQHRYRYLRWRLGRCPTLAFLGRPANRRSSRRGSLLFVFDSPAPDPKPQPI
jgi:glycerol uptake facilitator-like aquaporin